MYIKRNTVVIACDSKMIYKVYPFEKLYYDVGERLDRTRMIGWNNTLWICTEIIR